MLRTRIITATILMAVLLPILFFLPPIYLGIFFLLALVAAAWEAVLMTILGGIGTLWGPIIGAAIVVNLQNYLANLGGWSTIITGVIFVVCVLAFRRGVVGEIIALYQKSQHKN